MPLDATSIDSFVRAEGEQVEHRTGMRCWCVGANGQLDPNCRAHDITGSVYDTPKTITGLFTDIMQRKELASSGFFLPGDAIFSPLTGDEVSEGDKITLLQPLPYGKGDALLRGNTNTDFLYYRADSGIFCMDENRVKYTEGIDYQFADKTIVWEWAEKPAGGKAPAIGVRYTIKYRAYIDWIAFFPPMERFSHGADIGAKVMLRKLHLLGNGNG